VHIQTRSWTRLTKELRDKRLEDLGIARGALSRIRSFDPKRRIREATRAALKIDDEPNSDLVEYIAGYSGRGGIYHHFRSFKELLKSVGSSSVSRRFGKIRLSSSELDSAEVIPRIARGITVHIETAGPGGMKIIVWQKVKGRMRSIMINRKISKTLFLSGVMLYAGEGSKYSNVSRRVEITNSSPPILRLFVRFLGELGIRRQGITARVQIHDSLDEPNALEFWRKKLFLQPRQFTKTILKKSEGTGKVKRKTFTLTLRYSNTMLNILLKHWTEDLEELVRQIDSL
jgi:hypothetical protein